MQKILPIYYSEYGRYITRFRSIPFYIDCLIPVHRRILVELNKTAKDKFVKSAKIVGNVIGSTHPHGDVSVYGSLVNLVHQQYAIGQGNWGAQGKEDDGAAAMRYTETKLSKWVKDLVFEYIDYVPWGEYEHENEPLYLPSPIPVGLIGHGIYSGIAFHRPLIPKYKLTDLAKRLVGLLENKMEVIIPNFQNCQVLEEEKDQFENILKLGQGRIVSVPFTETVKNKLFITGRSPNTNFDKLVEHTSDPDKKVPVRLIDIGPGIRIQIEPDSKKLDINKLAQYIWEKYLIKRYNINVITCNEKGNVVEGGIDDILLRNYQCWVYAALNKNSLDLTKLGNKKFEHNIIYIVRDIIEKYKCQTIDDILTQFSTNYTTTIISQEQYDINNNTFINIDKTITPQDISDVCSKKSIKALVQVNLDLNQINIDINNQKQKITNTQTDCFNRLKELL